ncbi:UDP-glucose:glycoprotein glucosyltransferase [Camellia lanceoleosa]|uniref:UDP-glucose:glycoprotein glucosyltransferase n=1 Tax=Camellia lanceoleosa TaxID=1840588 RepID=A0ACC0INP9_9ERIC|nr:UDP-glucose:glycoprotein glucosyltransferase [Camellia lanceoleosa]
MLLKAFTVSQIEGSKNARLGMLFNANPGASFPSLLFVKASEVPASSYSHKAKVLDFLDQLCAFYEQEYVYASSVVAESNEAFIDKTTSLPPSTTAAVVGGFKTSQHSSMWRALSRSESESEVSWSSAKWKSSGGGGCG